MVQREQQAATCSGERRQLGALAGQANTLVQRAQLMLSGARDKAAAALRFLGEEVPAEPAFSQAEPRRMLTDLADFFGLLHRAHADAERMAVCLATLQQQRQEEEAERQARKAAREAAAEAAAAEHAAAEPVAAEPAAEAAVAAAAVELQR